MAKIPPDERAVYLAFKNIFKGPDALLRRGSKIKKKINGTLLEADIFESTLKAKIRFPEVFDVSPAQSAERAVSEAEAARTEADAIRDVVVEEQDESVPTTMNEETVVRMDDEKQPAAPVSPPEQRPLLPETFTARSLYPVYLPVKSQRRLLCKVQDILEHACYTFAKVAMAHEIRKHGWDSPDCVELNMWMRLFKSKKTLFDAERIAAIGKPLLDLLSSVAQIRHTAVHRLRVTAGKVELFLTDAESLTALLADGSCARQLLRLRRETHSVVEEFGRNKDLLELRYMEKRKEIAARRAELDRIEYAAWEAMLEEDKQYQSFAGAILEEVVDIPVTALHSKASSEVDGTSEEDTSVESEGDPDSCRVDGSAQGFPSVLLMKERATS